MNRDGVAVIIGNKAYAHERVPEVSYAHRDADAFKRYVTEVLGFREGNIIDLRDATQAEMISTFGVAGNPRGRAWGYLRPEEADLVVYYSGHGVPGQSDGRGYLLPSNADPSTAELNGYPIDVLYENLAALKAKSVTVFIDACFSGNSPKGMLIQSASPVFVRTKPPTEVSGLTVLTAASGDQLASWDEEARHGLFTRYLLEGLYGKADDDAYGKADGRVTLGEVKGWLDREMTYAARRHHHRIQDATAIGDRDVVLAAVPSASAVASFGGEQTEDRQVAVVAPVPRATGSATSAPSFDVVPTDLVRYVTTRSNVRSGPGTAYARVGVLEDGAQVEVTGKVADTDWLRIALPGGKTAFVYGPLLREETPSAPEAQVAVGIYPERPKAGTTFRDCADCPEMVVIPPGEFLMGSPAGEEGRRSGEGPRYRVRIDYSLAVGRFEVTFAEWDACVSDGGCNGYRPDDVSWGRGSHPVINVGWKDAQAYVDWLSRKTGETYRLLSESEWEYVARAGTQAPFHFGDTISTDLANYNGDYTYGPDGRKGEYRRQTLPVGRFAPNGFGLHDVHGNVWEWVEDCWHDDYGGAPSEGAAWTVGCDSSLLRVLRGGGWRTAAGVLRSAARDGYLASARSIVNGFRVARTLPLVAEGTPGAREARAAVGVYPERPKARETFRDCDQCPEMVVIPPGEFWMGSPADEEGRSDSEGPQHQVRIDYSLAVGRFEVTFWEWDACVSDSGCDGYRPDDESWGRGSHPVINVSWKDALAYVDWLSRKTGETYRLLSESEWEYVARAGTQTPFYFGETISTDQANYDGGDTYGPGGRKGVNRVETVPVGRFAPNAFGLHDVHGNVWEWVEDCWHDDYVGAPSDGAAWMANCDNWSRVLRGGSWDDGPSFLRTAYRFGDGPYRLNDYGFRVARKM